MKTNSTVFYLFLGFHNFTLLFSITILSGYISKWKAHVLLQLSMLFLIKPSPHICSIKKGVTFTSIQNDQHTCIVYHQRKDNLNPHHWQLHKRGILVAAAFEAVETIGFPETRSIVAAKYSHPAAHPNLLPRV